MHQFHKFILAWNSTCYGQFLCPSSGVHSLYTQQWYISYRFVDSFRAGPGWICSTAVYKPVWHIPLLSVQWMNSWWWTDELSETCRVSCQNKFVKLVHLVCCIIKKFVMMHGHMNVKKSHKYLLLNIIHIWRTNWTVTPGNETTLLMNYYTGDYAELDENYINIVRGSSTW
jgi:hypothetical protein